VRSMTEKATVVSVNVGTPRAVETPSGVVMTSIFKSPIAGRVAVRGINIAGDRQADLTVHGGPYKAVYCYPEEHYSFWQDQLPDVEFTPGMFGENLTTHGLTEADVHIGERFGIGSAVLQVTQPRMPCFKLALRFQRSDIIKRFWKSGRSGIYFSIFQEGELAAGDTIQRLDKPASAVTIADVVALYRGETSDAELRKRALSAPLHGSWKRGIGERLPL
jgi:MOSC domain-containing protein YiiM